MDDQGSRLFGEDKLFLLYVVAILAGQTRAAASCGGSCLKAKKHVLRLDNHGQQHLSRRIEHGVAFEPAGLRAIDGGNVENRDAVLSR